TGSVYETPLSAMHWSVAKTDFSYSASVTSPSARMSRWAGGTALRSTVPRLSEPVPPHAGPMVAKPMTISAYQNWTLLRPRLGHHHIWFSYGQTAPLWASGPQVVVFRWP